MTLTLKPPPPTVKKMGKTADELGIKPLTETALKMMTLTEVLTCRRPGT